MAVGERMTTRARLKEEALDAGDTGLKSLLTILQAAKKQTRPQGQQQIGDDRPADAGLDNLNQAFGKRDYRDDHLRRIAKGRIQEATHRLPHLPGNFFG